ncbi:MAG: c-type cytochrome [Deltaproteobacteria bacterium]|nr:c-type cytochrome [Deltaproteobacteria bacterium]
MDFTQRRTFALGAIIAVGAGAAVGTFALRAPSEDPSEAEGPTRPTQRPTQTQTQVRAPTEPSAQPPTGSCLLEPEQARDGAPSALGRSGGAIALSPDESLAAIADGDNNTVVLLSIAANGAQISTRFATGAGPAQVLLTRDGRAIVTERRAHRVSVYEAHSGRRLCSTTVAADPVGLAMAPDGHTLLVSSAASAKLTAIDARTFVPTWTADTEREPHGITIVANGTRAVLAHTAGKPLSAFALSASSAEALTVPDAPIPPENSQANQGVLGGLGQLSAGSREGPFFRGRHFPSVPFAPTAPVVPIPSQAYTLVAMPETQEVLVPFMVNRTGRELPAFIRVDSYGGGSVSETRQNEKVTFALGRFDPQTLTWRGVVMPEGVRVVRGRDRSLRRQHSPALAQSAVRIPMAATLDAQGQNLIVTSLGSAILAAVPVGIAPPTTALPELNGGGSRRHPGNRPERPANLAQSAHSETLLHPSGVVMTRGGTTLVFSQFEHAVEVRHGDAVTRLSIGEDPLTPELARGRRLFYTANNPALSSGGMSCGGCHPDGRDDGLTWFLSHGPRQTPTLAGRLVAPFNWTGTHRTIEGNVAQTITRLGGTGLPISDVDALAAYVQRGIATPPSEPPTRAPAADLVAHGRDVFQNAGNCASCHDSARNFTDGMPHELANLGPDERERTFDTPSLRYVRNTAPYFHDGRYQTLRALLTDGRTHMGTIGTLETRDVDALEAYMQTL